MRAENEVGEGVVGFAEWGEDSRMETRAVSFAERANSMGSWPRRVVASAGEERVVVKGRGGRVGVREGGSGTGGCG